MFSMYEPYQNNSHNDRVLSDPAESHIERERPDVAARFETSVRELLDFAPSADIAEEKDAEDIEQLSLEDIDINDSLRLYFKQVAREPLLTKEEEQELARQIKLGEQARKELAQIDTVDDRYLDLIKAIEFESEARDRLLRANSRLVISIAKKYVGRGIPFIDLIQEGNIGLMRSAKKFDYRLGLKFSTYATWWIRQAITRAISNDARTIRLPVQLGEQITKLRQAENKLTQDLSRKPTEKELALTLEIPPSKVRELKQFSQQPASLEAPIFNDDENSLGDIIEDSVGPAPEDIVSNNMTREQLHAALSSLSPKEHRILHMRFGFTDGRMRSLAEIGRELGVTRERVRQIESRALKRLRSPQMKTLLQQYAR